MDDEFRLKNALDTAWAVHLATRREVGAGDPRRCSLWLAGENNPEELTCCGLSYLALLGSENR
jgi:hypothetical protein